MAQFFRLVPDAGTPMLFVSNEDAGHLSQLRVRPLGDEWQPLAIALRVPLGIDAAFLARDVPVFSARAWAAVEDLVDEEDVEALPLAGDADGFFAIHVLFSLDSLREATPQTDIARIRREESDVICVSERFAKLWRDHGFTGLRFEPLS